MGDWENGGNPILEFPTSHSPILRFPNSPFPNSPIPKFPPFSNFHSRISKCKALGIELQGVRMRNTKCQRSGGTGEFWNCRLREWWQTHSPILRFPILQFSNSPVSHSRISPLSNFPISDFQFSDILPQGVRNPCARCYDSQNHMFETGGMWEFGNEGFGESSQSNSPIRPYSHSPISPALNSQIAPIPPFPNSRILKFPPSRMFQFSNISIQSVRNPSARC